MNAIEQFTCYPVMDSPRNYALELISDGMFTGEHIATILLKAMSQDDIAEALDANELSPRFNPSYMDELAS